LVLAILVLVLAILSESIVNNPVNPPPRNYDNKFLICSSVRFFHIAPKCSFNVDQFMQTFDSKLVKNPVKMVVVRCLILCSKFGKNRLSAGLCQDLLGELTALPQTP